MILKFVKNSSYIRACNQLNSKICLLLQTPWSQRKCIPLELGSGKEIVTNYEPWSLAPGPPCKSFCLHILQSTFHDFLYAAIRGGAFCKSCILLAYVKLAFYQGVTFVAGHCRADELHALLVGFRILNDGWSMKPWEINNSLWYFLTTVLRGWRQEAVLIQRKKYCGL